MTSQRTTTLDRATRRILTGRTRAAAVLVATMLAVGAAEPARADSPAQGASSAEDLAAQAYRLYSDGKYTEAIAGYLRVYEITGASAILINVATIYHNKLHERDLAAEYYRRYLRAPDAEPELVKKSNDRLIALKKEADEEAALAKAHLAAIAQTQTAAPPSSAPSAPSRLAPPPEPPPSSSKPLHTAGVVVGVTGVAALGASGVLIALAAAKNKEANTICNGNACRDARGVTLAHDASTEASIATAAFVGGLVLVGAGITIYALQPSSTKGKEAALVRVVPAASQATAGLSLIGAF